jgi:hypothetical protein
MRWYWLAGLGLLLSGCGVADYEQKMIETQKRQQYYEEVTRLLGPSLRVPAPANKEGKKVALADMDIRPPMGIDVKCANENEPRGGMLYSYHPRKPKAAGAFALVELAFGDPKQKDWAVELHKAGWPSINRPAPRPTVVNRVGRPPVTFQTTEFQDNDFFYSVNHWQGKRRQLAVVYWVQRSQAAASKRVLTLSLESFHGEGERVNRAGPLDFVPPAPQ